MSSAREHKDPFDYTYEELEELSRKPKNERTEEENEALAESRFTQFFDENSVDEETWESIQKLKKHLKELREKRSDTDINDKSPEE